MAFSRYFYKNGVCQTVEDINEDQPTYFHLWKVLGIIFKKPLLVGLGNGSVSNVLAVLGSKLPEYTQKDWAWWYTLITPVLGK